MNLANIIGALTGNDTISELSKKFNIEPNKVSSVINAALPTLIGTMQKNAGTETGAAALAKALSDHAGNSGSLISNLQNVDLNDGAKILSKIFGGNLTSILTGIGKQTGTTNNQVSSILSAIAPSLLNILGKLNTSGSGNGLGALLGTVLGGGGNSGKSGSVLGSVLGKILGK